MCKLKYLIETTKTIFYIFAGDLLALFCHIETPSKYPHADVWAVKKNGVTRLKRVNANYPNRQMSLHCDVRGCVPVFPP